MGDKISHGFVDLTIKHDVATELELRPAMIDTLGHIARLGNEIDFSWSGLKPESREMIADMIQMGLVEEPTNYVAEKRDVSKLRMTAKGSNVYDESKKTKIVASETKIIQT